MTSNPQDRKPAEGPATSGRMVDYKSHYRADAEAIVDPGELDPLRHASEHRRFEALVRLLKPGNGEKVLDVGCGSGWLAFRCQNRGARVWAMDIGPVGVTAARRRFPDVSYFQVGDVYHLPFATGTFDVLVLSEVIEHLEEVDRALAEVRRVMRVGARVLIGVPYREKIVEHLCIHCNRPTPANAHLHSFGGEKLGDILRNQGFRMQKTTLMTNKLLELAGFPRWSYRWPYGCWRGIDRLFNWLIPRPAFLCVLAVKEAAAEGIYGVRR